jgi:hypothetical protein
VLGHQWADPILCCMNEVFDVADSPVFLVCESQCQHVDRLHNGLALQATQFEITYLQIFYGDEIRVQRGIPIALDFAEHIIGFPPPLDQCLNFYNRTRDTLETCKANVRIEIDDDLSTRTYNGEVVEVA